MKHHKIFGLILIGVLGIVGATAWLPQTTPEGEFSPAFFIAAGIFVLTFAAISLRWMHETAAALLGAVVMLLVHYVGGTFFPALRIIGFDKAMTFVDWNVIFLILGMMIFMSMFSETGVFRWLALRAFRLTRGNAWLLGMLLISLTGLTSAFLNNVTAILLLVPLSIPIAQTVGVHPFTYVIPEVLASNIGGAATIIGDPPSTIVGSHLGLGFVEYLVNMAPIAILCMIVPLGIMSWLYRREFAGARERLSPVLVAQLETSAHIADLALLRKAGLVGLVTLILFFTGDFFGLPPSVIALTGAVLLIAWVQPDMHRMLREVDWTTLVFFIGIFILVGGLEATGVVDWVAGIIGDLAGDNLTLATILMVWVPGIASAIVDNIPFTVAALPIADFSAPRFPVLETRLSTGHSSWAPTLAAMPPISALRPISWPSVCWLRPTMI